MHIGLGEVVEVYLDACKAARIACPSNLIPAPGQYLLAYADGSDSPLADPIFSAGISSTGFLAAPPWPKSWLPGTQLHLRGPLGHGFKLPAFTRHMALMAFHNSPARLLNLIEVAFKQDASVVLLCEDPPEALPLQVEVQPLEAFTEICNWADYMAIDVERESLPELEERLRAASLDQIRSMTQILVGVPMPCGGLASCGVCIVTSQRESYLACEKGPVFDMKDLF